MPKNYWMVVQTPENFRVSRGLGFKIHGLTSRQRRRARRMEPDDKVLFYIAGTRKWPVIANVASKYYEDRSQIWHSNGQREVYPFRVKLAPAIVLDEDDYIDAMVLGPRLEYLKKWPPERWPLAFVETLHLLPQRDFRLIEGEMKRIQRWKRRADRRRRGTDSEQPQAQAEIAAGSSDAEQPEHSQDEEVAASPAQTSAAGSTAEERPSESANVEQPTAVDEVLEPGESVELEDPTPEVVEAGSAAANHSAESETDDELLDAEPDHEAGREDETGQSTAAASATGSTPNPSS